VGQESERRRKAACPRCGRPLHEPTAWSSAWRCDLHGEVHPLLPAFSPSNDGLDGLLTGVTAISGLFLFAISLGHGNLVAALVLSSLVGAALGFLPYNFNPAKIILGDTGSLFIGYIFATVSVMTTSRSP